MGEGSGGCGNGSQPLDGRRVVTGVSPSSMLQRSSPIPVGRIEETNMHQGVDRKDDKRRLLLKWLKSALRNPWLFRFLMILWKLYDHFDRD